MKNMLIDYFSKSNKKYLIIAELLVVVMIVLIPFSLASDIPISSVEIKSESLDYDKEEPGSFKITKSAKWISKGKAQITFDVDTISKSNNASTNLILVLDISGSMVGDKIDRVKHDATQLINSLLTDSNNRVSLITFDTSSRIVSNFTNDKEMLINMINNLYASGSTNYYQALVNVDTVLKDYQKESNREVITLFLTDGYPNIDIPNEENQFKYLKEKYPYHTINGIQYEMGEEILEPIKKVSDKQFIADIETLNNGLFDASITSISYDYFEITDYINTEYFIVEDKSDIEVSQGDISLLNNNTKIKWNVGFLKSGLRPQMTIEVKLKDKYQNKGGIYPTNTKEEIKSLIDNIKENVVSDLTPKLKNNYQVIYDGNAPDGCKVENVEETKDYSVFSTVTISDIKPICTGYKFKGWKIATDGVQTINADHFVMPEADVTIRAEWSKVSVDKSMDGSVYNTPPLYKMIAQSSTLDNISSKFVTSSAGIDFGVAPSDTNGKGVYELAGTKDDKYPVYYYRGAVTNNNVKFANFCWKIVRTTATGGIKIIYNGVPNSNGACNNTGTASQIGTSQVNTKYNSPADGGYMYGTRYNSNLKSMSSSSGIVYGNDVTYENGVYTLKDTMTSIGWGSDYKTIATKYHYTCFTTGNTCSSVYYIHSFGNQTHAYYLVLNGGKNIEDVKNEMFANTNNSNLKVVIDKWYRDNMLAYTSKLEDTVWCNDRSISEGALKSKDEDASNSLYTYFGARYRNLISPYKPNIACANINDSFTVNGEFGNGALTYPVALLTADEVNLAGSGRRGSNSSYLYTGQEWWTLSPYYFGFSDAADNFATALQYSIKNVSNSRGVRPSVSLQPGIVASDGDGTNNNPYVIE